VNVVNQKLQEIANLNKEILAISSSGGHPNDLLDQRDLALDEISKYVDVTTSPLPNDQIDVIIGGVTMVSRTRLLDTLTLAANPGPAPPTTAVPTLVQTVNGGVVLNDGAGNEITSGKIKGLLDVAGNTGSLTSIQSTLEDLNNIVASIVNEVNALQTAGRDLNGALAAANPIFTPTAPVTPPMEIFQYQINPTVMNDPRLVAAAINDPAVPPGPGFAGPGDNRNAVAIAQLRTKVITTAYTTSPALGSTFEDALNNTISVLGVDANTYTNRVNANNSMLTRIDQNRQSVSGVNIDEEMVDMLRFQRAFEASSKVMNVYDEVIQGILNIV
jgi:flagellar hook-associated protein 1 FlgK